jgi:signal transduction histidine kinase/tetratricopeptide (TPR) repeat protein
LSKAKTQEYDTTFVEKLDKVETDTGRVNLLLEQAKKIKLSDPNLSYEYAKQAYELSLDINYDRGKAESMLRMGTYYIYHTDFNKALEFISEALKISEKIKNQDLVAKCLMNLGLIYYDNKNYNQAISYFEKSLKIAKEIDNKLDIAGSLTNFGNVYSDMGDYKLALENFQNALKLYVEIQDKEGISKSLFNIGNVYFNQNNFKAALDYYQKSLKIDREQEDKLDIVVALNAIGNTYLKLNNIEKALQYSTQSLDLAWEINSQDDISRACYVLSSIYAKKNDYKTAFAYFKMATKIKESLFNQEKNQMFGKLEAKYQLEKQEAEIRLLKQDKQLKEELASKEILMKNIIIAGILMFSLVVMSVILYNKNLKEHQINTQLKQRNKEIMAQAEALKILNEELDQFVYRSSHDLKAPLTSVLGLINILKINIKDENVLMYLDKIEKSINKLMLVLHDLTNYSRNSRLQIEHKKINFNELLSKVKEELSYLEQIDKIDIVFNVNEEVPFISDFTRVKILLTNLLSNAIVHHDLSKSNPFINVDIQVNREFATISVKDNGKGIEDRIKGKIFDMFFKGSNDSLGSGLGLYIANGVVKKMNGKLEFTSTHEQGSEFIATLPNNNV